VIHTLKKHQLRQISARNGSAIRAIEKSSIISIGSQARAFQQAIDKVPKPPRW